MQNSHVPLSRYRRLWIVGLLTIVLALVIGLVIVFGRAYRPLFREYFTQGSINPSKATATPTTDQIFTSTQTPRALATKSPAATPGSKSTVKPRLILICSKEDQIYLHQEPGGAIIRPPYIGSALLASETQVVQGLDWMHGLYVEGEEDLEYWVPAPLVIPFRSYLPIAKVTGVSGANSHPEPGGRLVTLLPLNRMVQTIETADGNGITRAYAILSDE